MNSGRRVPPIGAALAAALPVVLASSPTAVSQPAGPSAQPASRAQPDPLARPRPPDSPEVAALRAAFLAGSADDLARAGDHLSVNQLADVLAGEDRELALAAARAAPTA